MTEYQITKHPYSLWLKADPCGSIGTSFKFQTTWDDSKDPNDKQTKFQMILSADEIQRLIDVLTNELQGLK